MATWFRLLTSRRTYHCYAWKTNTGPHDQGTWASKEQVSLFEFVGVQKSLGQEEIKTHLSTPKYSPNGPLSAYTGITWTSLQSPFPAFHRKLCGWSGSSPRSSTPRNSLTRFPPACLLPVVAPESRQPPACFFACGPEASPPPYVTRLAHRGSERASPRVPPESR